MLRGWLVTLAGAAALAAAVSGCGAGASAQTSPRPLVSFPDLGYRYISPHLPRGSAPATVFVVDLANAGLVRPAAMRFASDSSLGDATWRGWGQPSTIGRGMATIDLCNPDCGAGKEAGYPAKIVLGGIRRCLGHRFYTTVRVSLETADGPRSWGAFIRDPCSAAAP